MKFVLLSLALTVGHAQYEPAGTQAGYEPAGRAQARYEPATQAAEYHPVAAQVAEYHPVAAQVAAYQEPVGVQELDHIHPACNSGGPTAVAASFSGYRKLGGKIAQRKLEDYIENVKRSLEEDDLEEPFDDPGCGHGVCVLAPGGRGECICDQAFMTTPDSGPCEQHQKSQGVAFILQLFLGPFGAGCFYLGGGWIGSGVVCLLCGALAWIMLPIVCCVKGFFNNLCGECGVPTCCPTNENTILCCAGIMQCAMVITWFVSLIYIGVDCKVDSIPCVPM